jgi:hypothetical protein
MNQLRLATALAHTIRGVTLELNGTHGDTMTVAYDRLDAALNPCQLRSAVVAEGRSRLRLLEVVSSVRIEHGLEHLGGGLYGRGDERWFATFLDHEDCLAIFDRCEIDIAPESMDVSLRPDTELGVTVVRVGTDDPALGFRLDEVGFWALAACMVEETLHACDSATPRPTKNP